METQERNIIRRVLNGDTQSYRLLMDWYSPRVFAMVVRIVKCQEDAEEITQDVFMKAYSGLSRFDGRSSFSTWLYRIAYNESVSHTRKSRSPETVIDEATLRTVSDSMVNTWFDSDDPRMEALPAAIDCLSVEERALLTFHYFDGMPLKEAAALMGIGESTAKVRLMRTRKKLYILISNHKNGNRI